MHRMIQVYVDHSLRNSKQIVGKLVTTIYIIYSRLQKEEE